MRVEGADFSRTAHVQRHHDTVASDAGGHDLRALGQDGGDLGRSNASLGAKKTVADGNQNGRDRQRRGKARDQHHAPDPRKQRGLFRGRIGRNGLGHQAHLWNATLWNKIWIKVTLTKNRRLEVIVEGSEGSPRLDRVLAARLADLSRSRLKALILDGQVTVKDAPVRDPAYHVGRGDTITIDVPAPVAAEPQGEDIALDIVYEDDDLVVIDKPDGLVVHPGAGHETGTLVNALIAHCGESLSGIGGVKRPGIVHRLDKDTSGLLVVAKNDAAHQSLSAQFADHGKTGEMRRGYLAFVWGVPNRQRGTVDAPIDRHPHARKKMAVRESGRHAVTHWEIVESFNGGDGKPVASLLSCELETGRTHQIRVHLAYIGHPLMGDAVYGPHFKTKAVRLGPQSQAALTALDRQALHAYLLALEHPKTGAILEWNSDLPDDLRALRQTLTAAL